MQHNPTKHRPSSNEPTHTPGTATAGHTRDTGWPESFSRFLIDCGVPPIAFLGKCMQYFGLRTVAAFLLGAACLYGYAVFKHLPGTKSAAVIPPDNVVTVPAKKIWLHGTAIRSDTQFEIGVLAAKGGPFEPDGSYSIEVPESDRYLVIGWNPNYQKIKMQDMSPDASGTLPQLNFSSSSSDIARREGPMNNQGNKASDNYAFAASRQSQSRDGGIHMKNAFLGGSK